MEAVWRYGTCMGKIFRMCFPESREQNDLKDFFKLPKELSATIASPDSPSASSAGPSASSAVPSASSAGPSASSTELPASSAGLSAPSAAPAASTSSVPAVIDGACAGAKDG